MRAYTKEKGTDYCTALYEGGKTKSTVWGSLGYSAYVAAAIAGIVGVAAGPDTDDDANWLEKSRGTLIVSGGTLLGALGVIAFSSQEAATRASAVALTALKEKDEKDQFELCIDAMAEWIGSRTVIAASERRAWLTFDPGGEELPRTADGAVRRCGLPWGRRQVFRLELDRASLRQAGAQFRIPTLFDGLLGEGGRPAPDWRACRCRDQRPDQPWGHARDLSTGGAALPEIIVTGAAVSDATAVCLGPLEQDWSRRPYLARRSPPR